MLECICHNNTQQYFKIGAIYKYVIFEDYIDVTGPSNTTSLSLKAFEYYFTDIIVHHRNQVIDYLLY